MHNKDTQQCAATRSGMLAIRSPALYKLRHHIVVLLCSLWASAPVWAAEDLGRVQGLISETNETVQVNTAATVTSTALASVNSVALAVASVGSVASKTVLNAAGVIQHGIASWYGAQFQNKRTASGERFNMNALTAAHPTLPFGTKLCAHSPSTGKSVIVRINDRGPFVKHRIIDFSQAAAQALGIVHSKPGMVALLDSTDARCLKG